MASRYDDEERYRQQRTSTRSTGTASGRPTSGNRTSAGNRSTAGRSSANRTTRQKTNDFNYYDDFDEEAEERRRRRAAQRRAQQQAEREGRHPSGKKKSSRKAKAKKRRTRIILFAFEIVLLAVMLIVFWGVTRVEKVGKVSLEEEDIEVNAEVETNEQMKGYRTVALFGVDSTTGQLTKNTRSDTIILANINQDTNEIKLVSVYRDTYLNIGNDTYNKCNSAYAKGGPQQAINMLNQNLDLNIDDFVTVGFEGLIDIIDDLGGVTIDVQSEEIIHLNNYQKSIAEDLKISYTPVSSAGTQVLNGLQATAYCRIRYTSGSDFKRTQRQRDVLSAIMEKAKTASTSTLTQAANDLFNNEVIYTSLGLSEILELLGDVTSYSIVGDSGFPEASMITTGTIGAKGSCVVPVDLSSNVSWLHEYLFEETGYTPSDTVEEYSAKVKSDTLAYISY